MPLTLHINDQWDMGLITNSLHKDYRASDLTSSFGGLWLEMMVCIWFRLLLLYLWLVWHLLIEWFGLSIRSRGTRIKFESLCESTGSWGQVFACYPENILIMYRCPHLFPSAWDWLVNIIIKASLILWPLCWKRDMSLSWRAWTNLSWLL